MRLSGLQDVKVCAEATDNRVDSSAKGARSDKAGMVSSRA